MKFIHKAWAFILEVITLLLIAGAGAVLAMALLWKHAQDNPRDCSPPAAIDYDQMEHNA